MTRHTVTVQTDGAECSCARFVALGTPDETRRAVDQHLDIHSLDNEAADIEEDYA